MDALDVGFKRVIKNKQFWTNKGFGYEHGG